MLLDRPDSVVALRPNVPVLGRVELTKFSYAFRKASRLRIWVDAPSPTGGNSFNLRSVSAQGTENAFAIAFGGGTSFRISRHFGVVTTVDYIRPSKSGVTLNNIRVSGGPVFIFGGGERRVASYTPVVPNPARVEAPLTTAASAPVVKAPALCVALTIDAQGNETCTRYAEGQK